MKLLRWLLASLSVVAAPSRAGELPRAEPGEVGLSSSKLAELKPALRKLAEDGKIAGGVALIARHGKVVFVDAFGERDRATKAPMLEDSIFAIASMSKPITCVAAMTLVEQGKLGLDDPVSKYLPELKEMRVLGDPKDDTPDSTATVPSDRPIRVRDLFSHTSGFAYGGILSADPRLGKLYEAAGVQDRRMKTIAEQVQRLAKVPLAHQPGTRWTYGLSHDVLGRVIEVVSGRPFDQYLRECVLQPLDMPDTSFFVPMAKRDRVATIYRTGLLGGPLIALPRSFGSETFFSGGGGLFSTARDYARFAQRR
jgi:CubicO group peptidase (beta-lactamase class C family)